MDSLWFNRQGEPLVTALLGTPEWKKQMRVVDKLMTDRDYKIIGQDYTPDKKYWISTVWLGIDHGMNLRPDPNYKPIVFETMVFSGKHDRWYKSNGKRHYYQNSHETYRYNDEKLAERGHKRVLKLWSKK